MSEAHAPTRAIGHPSFSEAEWDYFQRDDRHAAAAIVLLMTAIFSTGLVMYATIAFIVAS